MNLLYGTTKKVAEILKERGLEVGKDGLILTSSYVLARALATRFGSPEEAVVLSIHVPDGSVKRYADRDLTEEDLASVQKMVPDVKIASIKDLEEVAPTLLDEEQWKHQFDGTHLVIAGTKVPKEKITVVYSALSNGPVRDSLEVWLKREAEVRRASVATATDYIVYELREPDILGKVVTGCKDKVVVAWYANGLDKPASGWTEHMPHDLIVARVRRRPEVKVASLSRFSQNTLNALWREGMGSPIEKMARCCALLEGTTGNEEICAHLARTNGFEPVQVVSVQRVANFGDIVLVGDLGDGYTRVSAIPGEEPLIEVLEKIGYTPDESESIIRNGHFGMLYIAVDADGRITDVYGGKDPMGKSNEEKVVHIDSKKLASKQKIGSLSVQEVLPAINDMFGGVYEKDDAKVFIMDFKESKGKFDTFYDIMSKSYDEKYQDDFVQMFLLLHKLNGTLMNKEVLDSVANYFSHEEEPLVSEEKDGSWIFWIDDISFRGEFKKMLSRVGVDAYVGGNAVIVKHSSIQAGFSMKMRVGKKHAIEFMNKLNPGVMINPDENADEIYFYVRNDDSTLKHVGTYLVNTGELFYDEKKKVEVTGSKKEAGLVRLAEDGTLVDEEVGKLDEEEVEKSTGMASDEGTKIIVEFEPVEGSGKSASDVVEELIEQAQNRGLIGDAPSVADIRTLLAPKESNVEELTDSLYSLAEELFKEEGTFVFTVESTEEKEEESEEEIEE